MFTFQIFISYLSGPVVMFALAIILSIVLYRQHDKKEFYLLLTTSTLAMSITYALKHILKVARPTDMLIVADSYRFPSGHATMASIVMSLGILYTRTHVHNRQVRVFLYCASVAWYILVSYSRIYLKAHYLVDVLVGGLIGVLVTLLVDRWYKNYHNK